MLDSAKLASLNGGPIGTKSYTQNTITAGTTLLNGTKMKVTVPFDQTFQWVSATQPNGAHKSIQIGSETISMLQGMQGMANPKDADGQNPCNTLLAPTQGAAFAIEAKANGWIVVLHKGSSNKQYFVFENGSPLGYKQGLMTYANPSLGDNGLLEYQLTGDQEYNYLTAGILLANTGFNKIAMIEDYFNDTLTSGIAWEQYRQNGVAAIAFPAYIGCNYLVGGAGTRMTAAAIVFVNGTGNIPVIAKGETVYDEYGYVIIRTYQDVNLLTIGSDPRPQHSGTCGPNLTWTLQDSVLTISGSGNMNDYYSWNGAPWYSYRQSITSVTIGNSVTSIGKSAFEDCSGLTSVTIGNSVTSIGNSAFNDCSNLTSVTIPNSVTSIGHSAFEDCSGLTSVTIPNSVTSIGELAFYGCSGLTSITIPNSVTSIGYSAFYGCYGLTSVHISDIAAWCGISFSSSSSNPLYYAKHLYLNENEITNLIIPNSVTSIGVHAFDGCSGLTSVTIGNSVTNIGEGAFYSCSGLTSVTIPNSVTSIGGGAFYGCSGLTSITIPNSVISIGGGAFSGCSGLTSISVESGNTHYDSRNNCNALIETTSNTIIAGCKNTVIPNSVTSIVDGAFSDCSGLTSITIPNSVTRIGIAAFYNCSGLTSITIPNSVTSIGYDAFSGCSSLTSVVWNAVNCSDFSNKGSEISKPFSSNITSFVFGNSVQHIPANICYYMNNLTSLTIPNSVTSIGDYAFYGCSGLDSVIWNARNCGDFNASPFNSSCNRVKVFVLGNSVQHIPANLCNGMTRIKEITIPANVETIGENAFLDCDNLSKVDVYNLAAWCNTDFTNTYCPLRSADLYINGTKPTRIDIPDGVTKVGAYTFLNCTQVTEVVLPSSVTEIGPNAFFGGSRLQTITLDDALETIGDNAFASCPYLLTINANMAFPPLINYSVFANCGALSGIDCYVPQGSLALYRKTPVWAEFNLHENETDLQSTQAENNTTQIKKILENGKLYILLPDGTKYSATGRKVE